MALPGTFIPAVETPLAEAHSIMNVNFFGPVQLTQLLLPQLLRARGSVINIGSIAATMPLPLSAVYCASKAALSQYTNVLRLELAPLGVQVRLVHMTAVATSAHTFDLPLPEDSMYKALDEDGGVGKKNEEGRAQGMAPERYAKELVGKVLRGPSWWRNEWEIWAGGISSVVWSMVRISQWWPWDMLGFMQTKMVGLDKLKIDVDALKKQD
jgi:1-acylglycerone phosphate reductase